MKKVNLSLRLFNHNLNFITVRNYNKHYLTAKPIERVRSCTLPLQLYDANNMHSISPTNDCIEYSTIYTTKNASIYATEKNSSQSESVINTNKTVRSSNGISKGATPKDVKNVTTTTKPAVLSGMLRYISINKIIKN